MKINLMKKKVSILIMFALIFTMMFASVSNVNAQFSDLAPNHWCYNKIVDFLEKGYVEGYKDGTFKADKTITRAEYVKIVNNFFGYSLGDSSKVEFKDVKSTDWFAPYVEEAVSRGYIEGYEDNTFRPYDPIRRQEATVILSRILKIHNETYAKNHKDGMQKYSDGEDVDEWAYKAIHSYSIHDFISGYPDGTIRLKQDVTRAETVELLNMLEQKIVITRPSSKKSKVLTPEITLWNRVELTNDMMVGTELKIDQAIWINSEMAAWNIIDENEYAGIFVNITDMTTDSMINEVTSRGIDPITNIGTAASRNYLAKQDISNLENAFFLRDGVHGVIATATKTNYTDSDKVEKIVKVDTVAPEVKGEVIETIPNTGVAHKQSIKVNVIDPTTLTTNISGLDTSKLRYAWFKMDEIEILSDEASLVASGMTYTRVTDWTSFENDAVLEAPTEYGTYKLGVSAYDIAGNVYGTEIDNVLGENGEEIEKVPYGFVEEIENKENIIVIVGNNAPTTSDLTLYTKVGEKVEGVIVATDVDGDELTYAVSENPTKGTTVQDKEKTTYTSSEAGKFTYKVSVSDSYGAVAYSTVTVYVYDVEIVTPPEKPENEPIDVLANGLTMYIGDVKELKASLIPTSDDGTYNWELVNSNAKEIEIKGVAKEDTLKVEGKIAGETKVKVTAEVNKIKVEKEVTITVVSKLTITANSSSKDYDSSSLTDNNYKVIGDVATGDVLTVTTNGEITNVGEVANKVTSYKIMRAGEDVTAKYYEITTVDGTLEITAKEVTVTANNKSKVYGENDPEFDATVVGTLNSDTLLYTVTRAAGETVGKYKITATGEETQGNYKVTFEAGELSITPVINKVTVEVTENSGTAKYDGAEHTVTGYKVTSISNPLYKETDFTFNGTAEVKGTNAGTYNMELKSSDFTNTSKDITNVEFIIEDGSLVISKRDVTIKSASDEKVYNGVSLTNSNVEVTGDGFVTNEGATYDVTGSQKDVGTSKNTFTYALNKGTLEENYNITKTEGTLEVTSITDKVTVEVTENSGTVKYDGKEHKVTGYEVTSISNPLYKETDFTFSGTAEVKGTNAGTYNMELKASDFTNISKNITNVEFIIEDGSLVISKRDVILTSASDTRAYNGIVLTNNKVTVTGDGFVTNEGATYDVTGSQKDVGISKNTFTYALKEGTLEGNYNITKTEGDLTVTKITNEIVIKADSDSKIYDGKALTDSGFTYEGKLITGDILSATVSGTITDVGTTANKVTSYKVMRSGEDVTANYTFGTSVDGELKVTAKEVTVTANNKTKVYRENDPEFDATVEGTIGTDTVAYTFSRATGENVGKYKITASGEETQGNYKVTFKDGELEITPIATKIIITADSNSKEYDASPLTDSGYAYTENVLLEGDVLSATVSGTITNVGTVANKVTSYKVTRGTLDVTNNYTFGTSVDGTLEITAKEVTVTANNKSKVYGEKDPAFDATVVGTLGDDKVTYTLNRDAGEIKGTYKITASGNEKQGNYKVTFENGELEITKITTEIVITADSDKRVYNGEALTDAGYDYTKGILVSGDTLTVTVSGTVTNVGTADNKVTDYKVMKGTLDVTDNYTFGTSIDGILEVTKKAVTIKSATDSKDFDNTPLTNHNVNATGFVSGEGATYTVTGSQTAVGTSKNTFTYELNAGTLARNYEITKVEGDLTVNAKKNVDYTVNHNIEDLGANTFTLKNTETLKGTADGSTKATYTAKTYTGFKFDDSLTAPSDLTILSDGSLVINLYYTRNAHKIIFDENGGSVVSDRTNVEYGEDVTITETTSKSGYTFEGWKKGSSLTSNFTMPDEDVTLVAVWSWITPKVEIDSFESTNFTDEDGEVRAEPGDTIEYDLVITNKDSNSVVIDVDFDEEYILVSPTSLEDISLTAGESITVKIKVVVPTTHAVDSDFKVDATVTAKSTNGDSGEADTATATNEIEKSSVVAMGEPENKNIVLTIDVSGSMLFCCSHTEGGSYDYRYEEGSSYPLKGETNWTDYNGYKYCEYPYKGHQYKNNSNNWVTCADTQNRIEVVKQSVKDFIDTIYTSSKANGEEVTITIVTFSGSASTKNTYKLNSLENATSLKSVINSLSASGGTQIDDGLRAATNVFNNSSNMIAGASNYSIFFGDGEPSSKGTPSNTDYNNLKNETDYSYAIGFGPDFANTNSSAYGILNNIVKNSTVKRASTADDVKAIFADLANRISNSKQSVGGDIEMDISDYSGKYYPITLTHIVNVTETTIATITKVEELATNDLTISEDGKTLTWDLSGTKYSEMVGLKIKLGDSEATAAETEAPETSALSLLPVQTLETKLKLENISNVTSTSTTGSEEKAPVATVVTEAEGKTPEITVTEKEEKTPEIDNNNEGQNNGETLNNNGETTTKVVETKKEEPVIVPKENQLNEENSDNAGENE